MAFNFVLWHMHRPIKIAGGGVGGLTLGVLLRREGVPVEIWEAGAYPRHRVCGEFISGRGAELIGGLVEKVPKVTASTVRFFTGGRESKVLKLPVRALCISRHTLDHSLAQQFELLGGELRLNSRHTDSLNAPGLVRATGRRLEPNSRAWSGFKFHAAEVPLEADLELHFSAASYAGISHLPGGSVNVCGLFQPGAPLSKSDPRAAFGPVVGDRLAGADIDRNSVAAVAGILLDPARWKSAEFRIGDSIAMIPPLTGNGMSLAAESAWLAAPILREYSAGRMDWSGALERYSQQCKKHFARRLRVSSFLQTALTAPRKAGALLSCLRTAPVLLRIFFNLTR